MPPEEDVLENVLDEEKGELERDSKRNRGNRLVAEEGDGMLAPPNPYSGCDCSGSCWWDS